MFLWGGRGFDGGSEAGRGVVEAATPFYLVERWMMSEVMSEMMSEMMSETHAYDGGRCARHCFYLQGS